MNAYTPKEIVDQLNRHIIGQNEAKKAIAIALRNRWRRFQIKDDVIRGEIPPKNILMIGPTGVGKTEISRRIAKIYKSPFIKIEATKFTEIGYVGRDVEQIIRDLLSIAIENIKQEESKAQNHKIKKQVTNRLLKVLVGKNPTPETKEKFLSKLEKGELDNTEIEIEVEDIQSNTLDLGPGMGSQIGMINVSEIFGKLGEKKYKIRKTTVKEAKNILSKEESENIVDIDKIIMIAKKEVEENGIVFLDEIDKICGNDKYSKDVSREGVQRDLLPLIEGTTVTTKHGIIKTDNILFICSGAFHTSKPSDLLPELQGRLPIRVELSALSQDDFAKILNEPEFTIIKQYQYLLKSENVEIEFTKDAIIEISKIAYDINENVENIGARRLHSIVEKLMEDISFTADQKSGEKIIIDQKYVQKKMTGVQNSVDSSKFIL